MNNEEKILEILSQIQQDVSGLKQDVSGLKQDVSGLKQDVSGLNQKYSNLQQDVTSIKITQETEVLPKIQLLFEAHEINRQNISNLPNSNMITEIKEDIDTLQKVIASKTNIG